MGTKYFVGTEDVNDGTLEPEDHNVNNSTSSGIAYTRSSGTGFVDVTSASTSITTTGNPVLISLVPDTAATSGDQGWIGVDVPGPNNDAECRFRWVRAGSTVIGEFTLRNENVGATTSRVEEPCGSITIEVDTIPAGVHTIKLQNERIAGNVHVRGCKVYVREMP